ncbi:acetyltransferase [Paenibacillus sp. J2TS4]|uniref:acetyltransferase n=1 Tax=Paenibacillus sp. J2TS4 TaxID=2807194 RepID=UPI001B1E8B92|nr:acetyltransferase [Paenibacillus sp. J2TS4]GIP35021.1 hypothetical protein J2TS4_42310 [Paenibacillus sp. J2TS4]
MAKLLIIGAGGHGKVVADAAMEMGKWTDLAFLDDRYPAPPVLGWPIVGKLKPAGLGDGELKLAYLADGERPDVVVAIGNNQVRMEWMAKFQQAGYSLPSIIHPSAWISKHAYIGEGCVIMANCAVNAGAVVGRGSILNTGSTVDHDCVLEEGVHLSPGSHIAGSVVMRRCSWLGIGASVIQQVTIGENAMIGAGAAVIHPMADGVTAVGVPAKVIKRNGESVDEQ